MAFTLNDGFLVLLVLLLWGTGIADFVEDSNNQDKTVGRKFFALLYIVFGLGLVIYKIMNR